MLHLHRDFNAFISCTIHVLVLPCQYQSRIDWQSKCFGQLNRDDNPNDSAFIQGVSGINRFSDQSVHNKNVASLSVPLEKAPADNGTVN
jgi:hypothetical protein